MKSPYCLLKTLCLPRNACAGLGLVTASHPFGKMFFQLAVEQRQLPTLRDGGFFPFFLFLKLNKIQLLTKNTYDFKHHKVQFLYIGKPPTKTR